MKAMAAPRAPKMPAQVPLSKPQPPRKKAPQVLQRPPAQTRPMQPVSPDINVWSGKTLSGSTWRSTYIGVHDQMTFTMATATLVLCLVILCLALVVYLSRQRAETSTKGVDSGLTIEDFTEIQTGTKDKAITEPLGPMSSTEEFGTSPKPSETEAPKMLGPEALLCTYGRRTTSDAVMASDGLCDYAFYDSLYADDRNKLSTGRPFKNDLETFMKVAATYNKTTSGIAFAFTYLNAVEHDLKNRNPSPLTMFWSSKIFHVGVLDTPESPKPTKWQQTIDMLRKIDNLLEMHRAKGQFAVTAFAVPYPDVDWSRELSQYFSKRRFHPDLLIVPGHYRFGDNEIKDCVVMPPTRHPDDVPPGQLAKNYSYDLSNGAVSLREFFVTEGINHGMLSVTLKGRWTEPKARDAMDFYSPCLYDPSTESFGSYTEVCKHTRYAAQLEFSAAHYTMLARHVTDKRAFAYDTEEGFCDKLCKVKENVPDVPIGIAVYDVDYDDYENHCSSLNLYGPHSRLKALRRIVDYFRSLASGQFNDRACTLAAG